MPPFLSVIVPTMRCGGIDVLFDALARSTFTDFEVVLSDCLYQRRHKQVAQLARDRFLRVVHVEPDPNPFPIAGFCACANVGLVHATGEVALFMVDYSAPPPDLLTKHAAFHRADKTGRAGLMGPHRYVALDVDPRFPSFAPDEVDEYARQVGCGMLDEFMLSIGPATSRDAEPWAVDGGGLARHDADPKLRMPAGAILSSFFHAKNESVRLDRALEINGWDEALDGTHCYQDSDFSDRLFGKAGVNWELDPTAVNLIANPRGVFPLAKRLRDFRDNERIWQASRWAGYPTPNKWNLRDRRAEVSRSTHAIIAPLAQPTLRVIDGGQRKLKVAMIYGHFSSAIHGPFDFAKLGEAGLTGSESSFFNLARSLAEHGHQVVVFAPATVPYLHPSGATMVPIEALEGLPQMQVDAVLAWNEPDYLKFAPLGALRVVDQQLNDWGYCQRPDWQSLVDLFVFPSKSSRENHRPQLKSVERSAIVPNSVDLDLFRGLAPERHPHRVVYCSSPDRGLHHLLSFWPAVRARVPDAELKIFYRIEPWLQATLLHPDEVGRRARYVEMALERMRDGWGVEVVGPVPNRRMAQELRSAAVLAYTCSPTRYTEGFGCSVLDAAAAGCLPIISDADALPEAHGSAAIVIEGRPDAARERWIDTIVNCLRTSLRGNIIDMHAHAASHSRDRVAEQWEQLLLVYVDALRSIAA